MPRSESIRSRVEALIEGAGWTASWLARQAGLQRSTISRLLRGHRTPSNFTLEAIAKALGISVPRLIAGTGLVLAAGGGDGAPVARAALRKKVGDKVRKKVRKKVADKVRKKVADKVRKKVADKVRKKVRKKVAKKVADKVRKKVADKVRKKVADKVRKKVRKKVAKRVAKAVAARRKG